MAVVAVVAVAVPATRHRDLEAARDHLAVTREEAAGARAARAGAEAEVAETAQVLTATEAESVVAARAASRARERLARTGVSEEELVATLDETQRRVDEVERRRSSLTLDLERQDRQLPQATACIDRATRALARAALAALAGRGPPTGSSDDCSGTAAAVGAGAGTGP